jgi:hypothetical protein
MRFFVDRCFPVKMCRAIALLEEGIHQIDYHDDHFEQTASDLEWLRQVGQWRPAPVVISGDTRILRKRDELRELVRQNLTFVCLKPGWMNMPQNEFAWKFLKAWSGIVSSVALCRQPTVFEVGSGAGLHTEKKDLTQNLA